MPIEATKSIKYIEHCKQIVVFCNGRFARLMMLRLDCCEAGI